MMGHCRIGAWCFASHNLKNWCHLCPTSLYARLHATTMHKEIVDAVILPKMRTYNMKIFYTKFEFPLQHRSTQQVSLKEEEMHNNFFNVIS